jgi:hypothetical protein
MDNGSFGLKMFLPYGKNTTVTDWEMSFIDFRHPSGDVLDGLSQIRIDQGHRIAQE